MVTKSQQESSGGSSTETSLDLRAIREARGVALNNVFEATRISIANLTLLESGEFHLLPPPIYTKAYIKAYAEFLNTDDKTIMGRYEKYLATLANTKEEESKTAAECAKFPYKKFIVYISLAASCVLLVTVYLCSDLRTPRVPAGGSSAVNLQRKPADSANNTATPLKAEVTATDGVESGASPELPKASEQAFPVQPSVAAKDMTKDAATREAVKLQPAEPPAVNRLIIKARETTWVRIREGNNKSFQVLMQPGEKLERTVSQFTLDVGNAGGISVEFQGKVIERLGKSGEVVHLPFPQRE